MITQREYDEANLRRLERELQDLTSANLQTTPTQAGRAYRRDLEDEAREVRERLEAFDGTIRFYGQAPGPSARPSRVAFLGGRAGEFLAELADVTTSELGRAVEFRNLLEEWPGAARGKGDAFPNWQARYAAEIEMERWEDGDRVVFAGRAVARAFGYSGEWFAWRDLDGVAAAVFPHPSRVSTYWNDAERVEAARRFMRSLVRLSPALGEGVTGG